MHRHFGRKAINFVRAYVNVLFVRSRAVESSHFTYFRRPPFLLLIISDPTVVSGIISRFLTYNALGKGDTITLLVRRKSFVHCFCFLLHTEEQSCKSIPKSALNAINQRGGNLAKYEKTEAQSRFLESVIKPSIFVGELPNDLFSDLVLSFEPVEYKKGTTIVKQGDVNADFMLVLEEGECAISIDGEELPDPYGTMAKGGMLGELALLYDSGRSATVTAKTDVHAFRLDQVSFKHFLSLLPTKEEDIKEQLIKIDQVIDKSSGFRTRYGGDVIKKFNPSRRWLWRRRTGTILQHAWKTAVANMVLSFVVVTIARHWVKPTWGFGMLPDLKNTVISRVIGLSKAWHYVMTLTTFTLTFFLSQAYALWRDIYNTARIVQGYLSDINLLLACSAERDKHGSYTLRAKSLLEDVASYTRLYHAFMWASFSKRLNVLLSDFGIRRMIGRGVLSRRQYATLQKLEPEVTPQHACIVWIISRCLQGMKEQSIPDDYVLREKSLKGVSSSKDTLQEWEGSWPGNTPSVCSLCANPCGFLPFASTVCVVQRAGYLEHTSCRYFYSLLLGIVGSVQDSVASTRRRR
jgi:hypothetical protein